jgi:serine/threonine-protein kinase
VKISAHPQQAHLVPGYRLDGRYELLYPYAQGGMATVWIARVQGKHGFEKLVAVKTILPHLAQDDSFRAMFLDEASIASRIRHPNVADILDLGEEADTLYMVLEWVNGDAWSKLYAATSAAGHPFPVDLLLRIAADACGGLHAAHELRDDQGAPLEVVHRDISPQNILITTSGVTKVIDFGIAKALDRTGEQTKTGMLKGKAQYAAPEQARDGGRNVNRRVDLWAIGTILYHYLSGRLPYEAKSDLATLRALTSGKPPPPLPKTVSPQVASVVMTALAFAAENRFQTALDMQRALEAAISTPTTSTDVAAFMVQYLSDRIDMRRQDLAEALAEAEQRSGKPKGPRQRLGSFPELARPAILDQVLGQRAGESSAMPQLSPLAAARLVGEGSSMPQGSPIIREASAMPQASPLAAGARSGESSAMPQASPIVGGRLPADGDDAIPTRMRGGLSSVQTSHLAIMAAAAVVPLVVWSLVAYIALNGPIGRTRPRGPAPVESAARPGHSGAAR